MTTLGVFRDDYYNSMAALPQNMYGTSTQNGGVLSASLMAGAQENYVALSGNATAQAITTDSAANIIARLQNAVQAQINALGQAGAANVGSPPPGVPNLFNVSFYLDIINNNTSAGVITLTGGAGVTITGTNTLAIASSRGFLVTVTGPNTVTIQNVGAGGV